jgi:hypothetical protein
MESKPGRRSLVARVFSRESALDDETLTQIEVQSGSVVATSERPGVVPRSSETMPQKRPPNPPAIVSGVNIQPRKIGVVDTGEPNDIATVFGNEHIADLDVLAFWVMGQRDEGSVIKGSPQLVRPRSVMHSADRPPVA